MSSKSLGSEKVTIMTDVQDAPFRFRAEGMAMDALGYIIGQDGIWTIVEGAGPDHGSYFAKGPKGAVRFASRLACDAAIKWFGAQDAQKPYISKVGNKWQLLDGNGKVVAEASSMMDLQSKLDQELMKAGYDDSYGNSLEGAEVQEGFEAARRHTAGSFGNDKLATDPPVSESQRKAMYAAAGGNSTLGIPKKVGEEFVGKQSKDHGLSVYDRKVGKDANITGYDRWAKAIHAKYPDASIDRSQSIIRAYTWTIGRFTKKKVVGEFDTRTTEGWLD
jgi:hypothetical protein